MSGGRIFHLYVLQVLIYVGVASFPSTKSLKRENKITESKNLTLYNVLLTNFIPRCETRRQSFDWQLIWAEISFYARPQASNSQQVIM